MMHRRATAVREPPRSLTLEELLRDHYAFVWRCLRRFGIPELHVDDLVQETFIVASRKLEQIEPDKGRAFLTGTALRLAQNYRRGVGRRPDNCELEAIESECSARQDAQPTPETLLQQRRERHLLDVALAQLPLELRAPFVLMALEGLTRSEIAELLELPEGTVATRVRKARQRFERDVRRLMQTHERRGDE